MGVEYRDYYKILGVDRKADDKTIKSAYRKRGLDAALFARCLRAMLRIGFEVRLTVLPDGAAPEDEVTVVVTRSTARARGLDEGSKVWLSANLGAGIIPPGASEPEKVTA